ncbi:SOS response-associated peptidase [Agromyces endophyticus]|uniref:SOS response-associated peptidase n=1 Tax=Agromyces sp. H17E-10 TaxID=2932244 RepID=UPI001FD14AC0|nr:SOS response-associated peptidase [Agromyces sp. H17E-10]UOQ90958.1 SOS response-associated peptidase [Agromyces sp. H17E-10]
MAGWVMYPGDIDQEASMCGRFVVSQKVDDLTAVFDAENDFDDWQPSFSLAPTDTVPIVRERADRETGEFVRRLEPAVWNFHPSFMKDAKRPQFNTRIETVATNGLWKGAFAQGRCIVPMRGYFEWTGEPGKKRAHYLHGEGDVLAAAGISTARKLPDGEWQVSTSIITREARDASGEVHDRMPVYLPLDEIERYLDPAKLDAGGMQAMVDFLIEASDRVAPTITEYEVDPRINNHRAIDPGDPTLIDPLPSGA